MKADLKDPKVGQVTYPWKAKKDTQLSLQKGDVVRILEQQEMWWLGDLNGVQGWLPKSCIRLVEGEKKAKLLQSLGETETSGAGVLPPRGASVDSETVPTRPQGWN